MRYRTLDGVRGAAVMGILLMNITEFALPQAAYLHPLLGGTRAADIAIWSAEFVLADGKFRNLFSLLFGATMLLVAERAESAGRSGAVTHYRRMGWLLLFGMLHFYLVWRGDILAHYAIVGSVAFLLRRLPPHKLFTIGALVLALDCLIAAANAGGLWELRAAVHAAGAAPTLAAQWRDVAATLAPPGPSALAADLAMYRGDFVAMLRHRMGAEATLPLDELLGAGPETFALMLFGMAALKSGFLTGAWPRPAYRRLAIGCYAAGLPVMMMLAVWTLASGFDPLVCYTVLFALSLTVRAVLMFGHAALLILWFTHGGGWLAGRVEAAGRVAFTNYLGTSVLMAALFYGFGAYGRFGRAELFLIVLGTSALMLAWSAPWLRHFAYGPLEWLWRSLARGAPQPMQIKKITIARHSQ